MKTLNKIRAALFWLLPFMLTAGFAAMHVAQAGSIDQEQMNYGSACTGNNDGTDWDTIFQCYNSTIQRAPYFFGYTADTCDSNHAGMVRYNPTTTYIEFCNGTGPSWTNMGATGSTPDYASVLNASQISVGFTTACYVTTGNALYCLGNESGCEVGIGTCPASYTSKPLVVSGSWSKVAAGELTACGLTNAGAAYCWGSNSVGQIGDNTTTARPSPTMVNGGYTWTDISTTGSDSSIGTSYYGSATTSYASCGITNTGAAYCWGNNTFGQLGNNNNTSYQYPQLVNGGYTWTSLARMASGYAGHMCGITNTGAGYCWGANNAGQLGNNSTTNSNYPVPINGGYSWSYLSIGDNNTCGVTTGAAAYCWGLGTGGQLGNNALTNSSYPVLVNGSLSWSKISAGDAVMYGVTTSGALYSWGLNGQGLAGTAASYKVPQLLSFSGLSGTKWVDATSSHNLIFMGLRDNGALYSVSYTSYCMSGVPACGSLILMQ